MNPMNRPMGRRTLAKALAGLAVLGAVPAGTSTALAQAQGQGLTVAELVKQVGNAVVTVVALAEVSDTATPAAQDTSTPVAAATPGVIELEPASSGSGFIIDEQGHIVTNWHVVYGGAGFAVVLADGTSVDADLVGIDPRDDLAVVKIDPAQVPATVSFGDSDDLEPGDPVVAIGSPLGSFTNSVTNGIVSGVGRNEFAESGSSDICQNYIDLIQHTAPINHGNSGGPLFSMDGKVVGVNTLALPTYQGEPTQGLFFALPSDIVSDLVQQLIQNGGIAAPYIGADMGPITPELNAQYDLGLDHGLVITDVQEDSPAAQAGLQEGDVILSLDGIGVTSKTSLAEILLQYAPGDTVSLDVVHLGPQRPFEERTVELTLGEVPQALFEQCVLAD